MTEKSARETIRCQTDGRVYRITLNRPKCLNAINGKMLVELREALAEGMADRQVRAFLLDSSCDKSFSAGIDVAYVKEIRGGIEAREIGRELHRTFDMIRTIDKPVVVAVDGYCYGAGLELALSCDLLIASTRSSFGLPEIHRGIPSIVEAAILPYTIGFQGARDMCFTGEFWDAEKAERRGLVSRLFPPEKMEVEVNRICELIASRSPIALGTQKEIIHKWMTTDLESAIDFSINTAMLTFLTPDKQEGMEAFVEKREATFGEEDS